MDERLMWGIRLVRLLSATIEVTAVILLLRMHDVRSMLRLNAGLGMVGPLIFITVSALGLTASLGQVQPAKLVLILIGVVLVIIGTR
jgi:hypothetical protein